MKDDVVVPQQDEIRIYSNEAGGISILQDDGAGNETVVWFALRHADSICEAIAELAKRTMEGTE